jgi:hypothetical protein
VPIGSVFTPRLVRPPPSLLASRPSTHRTRIVGTPLLAPPRGRGSDPPFFPSSPVERCQHSTHHSFPSRTPKILSPPSSPSGDTSHCPQALDFMPPSPQHKPPPPPAIAPSATTFLRFLLFIPERLHPSLVHPWCRLSTLAHWSVPRIAGYCQAAASLPASSAAPSPHHLGDRPPHLPCPVCSPLSARAHAVGAATTRPPTSQRWPR